MLLAATLDKLGQTGPRPDGIIVHLDAGYDSQKTRTGLESRSMKGEIAHKGDKAGKPRIRQWPEVAPDD